MSGSVVAKPTTGRAESVVVIVGDCRRSGLSASSGMSDSKIEDAAAGLGVVASVEASPAAGLGASGARLRGCTESPRREMVDIVAHLCKGGCSVGSRLASIQTTRGECCAATIYKQHTLVDRGSRLKLFRPTSN